MLLTKSGGVLHILKYDVRELQTVVCLHLFRTQHTMVKTEIADFIFLWRTPDHLIVVVARNKRVRHLEVADRRHESDSRSTASIKRIELSDGTSIHFHIATMHIERMLQRVGNLTIVYLNLGRINEDTIALTIVNRSILHQEFLPGHIA